MASLMYNRGKKNLADGTIDFDTHTIRVLLIKNTYTADKDHNFVSDLTPASNELSGTGYVRKDLANKAVNQDDVNDRAELDADDVTWTGINAGTAQAAVVYKFGTVDSDSPLLAYIEFSAPVVTNGGDFTIQFNVEGIIQLT